MKMDWIRNPELNVQCTYLIGHWGIWAFYTDPQICVRLNNLHSQFLFLMLNCRVHRILRSMGAWHVTAPRPGSTSSRPTGRRIFPFFCYLSFFSNFRIRLWVGTYPGSGFSTYRNVDPCFIKTVLRTLSSLINFLKWILSLKTKFL